MIDTSLNVTLMALPPPPQPPKVILSIASLVSQLVGKLTSPDDSSADPDLSEESQYSHFAVVPLPVIV